MNRRNFIATGMALALVPALVPADPVEGQPVMWKVKVQGQVVEVPAVRIARTPDELEDQFRAWVAGEKDWHDIVVDTYKARIKEKRDAIQAGYPSEVYQRYLAREVSPGHLRADADRIYVDNLGSSS